VDEAGLGSSMGRHPFLLQRLRAGEPVLARHALRPRQHILRHIAPGSQIGRIHGQPLLKRQTLGGTGLFQLVQLRPAALGIDEIDASPAKSRPNH
jgi:hypothetical protein